MIRQDQFPIEPWQVREVGLDLNMLAQSESLFALSNGHLGIRGNLDEGDPNVLPGTYLNSFYETRPLPYAEAGYGYPESGQTVVNVTDGKLIRLLVDDQPFDLRYGQLRSHERTLDLRAGVLRREVEWVTPSGRPVRVRSTRLVSLTQRAIMAVDYRVEAVDVPLRVVIQSELVANEEMPTLSNDPRVAAALRQPLEPLEHGGSGMRAWLAHGTRGSRQRMAAAMDHLIEGRSTELAVHEDWARVTVGARLEPGDSLRVTKFVAYGWSGQRSLPALRDQVAAALTSALHTGWDALLEEQRAELDAFWHGADVELDGDPAVQQAVRFALFHVLQSGARAEQRAIPAKGLTGPGYDGHAFWDTEMFVLPVLTATAPHAAADALRWRRSTIDLAQQRAADLRWSGAAFPWRTIRGQECSAYWPAGTAALHVNADIAAAAVRLVQWTGDEAFERECGLPLLVDTARLWISVGYHGADGAFHIDGITGPDEYSALVDDNTYTNLMARANLRAAADVVERYPDDTDATPAEVASWRAAADAMAVPYSDDGIPEQDRGFHRHAVWDFAASAKRGEYPLLLHVPYMELYAKQVVKQADLMLAMHWCGDAFSHEEKARAFAYYEPLTVRDSSLSACTQAVIAAEVGQLELAHEYLSEAALMDLRDFEHNTRDGLHIASLAGAWIAVVAGLGGMRDHGGELSFAPQLPDAITRLRFAVRWHGATVRVAVTPSEVTYTLDDGSPGGVRLRHRGEPFTLQAGATVTRPIVRVRPSTPRPRQPEGRAPVVSGLLSTEEME